MPGGRLDALFGYGLPAFGDRFTGTPWLGLGRTDWGRDMRIGWRLGPTGERAPNLATRAANTRMRDAGRTST